MSDTTTDVETPADDATTEKPASTEQADPVEQVEEPAEEPAEDEQSDAERGSKEAAKYRRQLRATEAERDQLRDQIAAQRRAVVDWRSANAAAGAVDPQLLDAAGLDLDSLVDPDTGHLDMDLVDTFIEDTAAKFRVHRVVKPNLQQGQPSHGRSGASWSDVIKQGAASG